MARAHDRFGDGVNALKPEERGQFFEIIPVGVLRAAGGNWQQQPEYGLSGTFVMRRVTMGLDAKQW